MAGCGICVKNITAKQIKISCSDCNKDFHGVCLKMTKADIEFMEAEGTVWRCDPCSVERRRSMRFDSDAAEGKLTLEDVMKAIQEIREGQKSSEKEFNTSYEVLNSKLEENTEALRTQTLKIEKYLEKIEELSAENTQLKQKVYSLEQRLEDMEQYSRCNTVDIQGIPVRDNENVIDVVMEVGNALEMEIAETDIDACHRMGKRAGSDEPPNIIVKFVRREVKEKLIQKRREKKQFSTKHLNLGMDRPIYINESLSPARRRLAALTRATRKQKNYKFMWIRGGKIYLRRDEGTPVIQVTSQGDLDKL